MKPIRILPHNYTASFSFSPPPLFHAASQLAIFGGVSFCFSALFLFSSCLRLDDNLYNLEEKITEYKWDQYSGVQDFKLDDSYRISDSMFHHFTLSAPGNPDYIHALYLGDTARIKTDTIILYCHGNKWHMDFYWQRVKLLAHVGGKHRFGVMMFDYNGYGLSKGKPSESKLSDNADWAMSFLRSRGLTGDRLVMYGFSMGTAPATELTAYSRSLRPHKLILEAPFASASVMAADAGGLSIPGSFVTNLKINNADRIRDVKQDLCWIHGENDNFLNIKTHGEVVYKNHGGSYKEAYQIPGADHGEVPAIFGFQNYLVAIEKFIVR